jgi:hypothetical protein
MENATQSFVSLDSAATVNMSNYLEDEILRGGGLDNPRRPEPPPKVDRKDENERPKQPGRGEPD